MTLWKYNKCGSCRKAMQFLDKNGISYTPMEILETPPTVEDLKMMLGYLEGNIKKLFNTSGVKYREGNYKEKIKDMSNNEILELLSENGALIKRPFVLGEETGTVGFKEDVWKSLFL